MSQTQLTLFVIAAFSIIFPLFWSLVVMLIAQVGGWSALARQFPDPRPPETWNRTWATGSFGVTRYKSTLKAAWDQQGLHLWVTAPFRPGHAPLFIPWSEIGPLEPCSLLFLAGVRFTVRGRDISFYGALAQDFEKARNAAG